MLTHTALRQAKAAVDSMLKSPTPFRLILTANGNPAAATYFQQLASEFPNIEVVINPNNEGYIEPHKKAFAMCQEDYFITANDDIIVPPDWLEKLEVPFLIYPTGALSAPRGGCQSLQASFHGYKGPAFEYLNGALLMCKTEVVRKHGLFDSHLTWAYGDDSDLSLRMRELGYTLHHADFTLQHEIGATSKYVQDVRRHQTANHAYLQKRWAYYLKGRRMEVPIIIKRGAAYGDVLLTTIPIQALRAKYPLRPIYVETLCPQVFENNRIVTKADRRLERMPDATIYDLTLSYERRPDRRIIDAYAEVCELTTEEIAPFKTQLFPSTVERRKAEQQLEGDWVAVHPGPNTWKSKEWPIARFAEVIAILRTRGVKVVLVGSSGAKLNADLDLRGQTTIMDLAALIERCKLLVGLDSFPLHVAEAMGVPAIGLFGVTDPKFILTRPDLTIGICGMTDSFGLRHRVKNTTSVDDKGAAMNSITVAMVVEAIEKKLPCPAIS